MANPDPLPAAATQSVVDQLGRMLASPAAVTRMALGLTAAAQPALAESLAVCTLTADQVKHPPADLTPLTTPTGMWHHQVRTAAGTTHLATSAQQGFAAAELDVQRWVESPIAARIDDAIAWVDANFPDDPARPATVRLLVIPSYFLHALLIVQGTKTYAVLADQPETFTRLQYETRYTLLQFLRALGREQPAGTFS